MASDLPMRWRTRRNFRRPFLRVLGMMSSLMEGDIGPQDDLQQSVGRVENSSDRRQFQRVDLAAAALSSTRVVRGAWRSTARIRHSSPAAPATVACRVAVWRRTARRRRPGANHRRAQRRHQRCAAFLGALSAPPGVDAQSAATRSAVRAGGADAGRLRRGPFDDEEDEDDAFAADAAALPKRRRQHRILDALRERRRVGGCGGGGGHVSEKKRPRDDDEPPPTAPPAPPRHRRRRRRWSAPLRRRRRPRRRRAGFACAPSRRRRPAG